MTRAEVSRQSLLDYIHISGSLDYARDYFLRSTVYIDCRLFINLARFSIWGGLVYPLAVVCEDMPHRRSQTCWQYHHYNICQNSISIPSSSSSSSSSSSRSRSRSNQHSLQNSSQRDRTQCSSNINKLSTSSLTIRRNNPISLVYCNHLPWLCRSSLAFGRVHQSFLSKASWILKSQGGSLLT